MRGISRQIEQAHSFLRTAEQEGRVFTREELRSASGWSESTFQANMSKKLKQFLRGDGAGFRAVGLRDTPLEAFARVCSQSAARSRDPLHPDLPAAVEGRLLKAREAALAAVQHYNNPTTLFRTDTFVVLMVVAYTALFHALCERDGVDYIARDRAGTPKMTGSGEPLLWDALTCAKHYGSLLTDPMATNLDYMVQLRHKIEHRFVPQLDAQVAGECQSLLHNFEKLLVSQFSTYYALGTSLAIALQVSSLRPRETVSALRAAQAESFHEVMEFISEYHRSLPDDIFADPGFALRVWLVPKPANEARRSDVALDFVDTRQCDAETLAALNQAIVAVKIKVDKQYAVATSDWLWEKDLTAQLANRLGATVTYDDSAVRLTNTRVRDVLHAADVRSRPDWCHVAHRPGARPCYHPDLVELIALAYGRDPQVFRRAAQGERINLEQQPPRTPSSPPLAGKCLDDRGAGHRV